MQQPSIDVIFSQFNPNPPHIDHPFSLHPIYLPTYLPHPHKTTTPALSRSLQPRKQVSQEPSPPSCSLPLHLIHLSHKSSSLAYTVISSSLTMSPIPQFTEPTLILSFLAEVEPTTRQGNRTIIPLPFQSIFFNL